MQAGSEAQPQSCIAKIDRQVSQIAVKFTPLASSVSAFLWGHPVHLEQFSAQYTFFSNWTTTGMSDSVCSYQAHKIKIDLTRKRIYLKPCKEQELFLAKDALEEEFDERLYPPISPSPGAKPDKLDLFPSGY